MIVRAFTAMRLTLWACAVGSTMKLGVGDSSLGLHVLLLLAASLALPLARGAAWSRVGHVVVLWSGLLVGHYALASLASPCTDLLMKSSASLLLTLLLATALARLASESGPKSLTSDMRAIVAVVCGSLALEVALGRTPGSEGLVRAGGIFPEPSHLALAMSPVLVGLMCAARRPDRLWGWGGFIVMTTLSASATLFLIVPMCLVMVQLAQSRTQLSLALLLRVALLIGFMAGLVMYSPYGEEFASRLAGLALADSSANVSSLVYVNGWETALHNLQQTQGLGLGFNRMGCDPRPDTERGGLLDFLGQGDLNYNDGSFTLSKLLSELGLLGLAFWASASLVLARLTLVKSGRGLNGLAPDVQALLVSGITVITLGALIRGTNYLSGPFLFGLFCVLFVCAHRPAAAKGARPAPAKPGVRAGPTHV